MNPYWNLSAAWLRMCVDAQMVVALRVARISLMDARAQGEMMRMTLEKGPAFWEAGVKAQNAWLEGKPPEKVASAALRPVASKARANRQRLSR